MTAVRRHRRWWATIAPATLAWAQACFPYQPPRPTGLAPGRDARLSSDTPFDVVLDAPPGSPRGAVCRATRVDGVVGRATRDTVHFDTLLRVVPATNRDPVCRWTGGAVVAVTPNEATPRAVERRFSAGRTALLVGGVTAVVVGGLAYIASTISFDLSSGRGSGGSCASLCWKGS